MQILRQLMVKKLYGKYYPISDKSKFLMEHKQYFLKLLNEQIRYTKGTVFIAYKHYGEHVYPEYTIFGCPNIKNIMKNQQARQFVANQVEPLQEINIRLYEIQNKLLEDKNDEISIDDISFVYELRCKRRKSDFIRISLQLVGITLLIIGLNLFF